MKNASQNNRLRAALDLMRLGWRAGDIADAIGCSRRTIERIGKDLKQTTAKVHDQGEAFRQAMAEDD